MKFKMRIRLVVCDWKWMILKAVTKSLGRWKSTRIDAKYLARATYLSSQIKY